ncbi:PH domain-containing protein [Nocardioides sp. CFH 31398]|uniref:PH domain-containing protein n=1 Tax=Nocardioides sp. CFH 31398 TaxID=2919579 RepID=UPI001F050E11|nr:PH domain-containing protein [Nocardioides sp. CFH 31398]MCH1865191.1 PH domain-containing protein [Nocardioides sp. CFH 31398]
MDVAGAVPPEWAERLPRAAASYLRLRSVLETTAVSAIVVIPLALLAPDRWSSGAVAAVIVCALGFLAVDLFLVIPRRLQFTRFTIRRNSLELWRGVVVRSHTIIPRDMVMNIELRQGPVTRMLGLSTLRISTVTDVQAFGPIDEVAAGELRRRFDAGATRGEGRTS